MSNSKNGGGLEKLPPTIKDLLAADNIKTRFRELLGKKAPGFISSVLQLVNEDKLLAAAEPSTIINAAATAAILDLPINKSFGYAWVIPYKTRVKLPDGNWGEKVVAQFQMGWRGFVQLGIRSGQYHRINMVEIYENQFTSWDPLREELIADTKKDPEGKVVGYAAYFRLINGFEKYEYWTVAEVTKHAKKYSKAYGSGKSPWNDVDQFDAMGMKTVLKNTLSKWGVMSIEMQTAFQADQSVQTNEGEFEYLDNDGGGGLNLDENDYEKERERVLEHIQISGDRETLGAVFDMIAEYDLVDEYNEAWEALDPKKIKNDKK